MKERLSCIEPLTTYKACEQTQHVIYHSSLQYMPYSSPFILSVQSSANLYKQSCITPVLHVIHANW